MGIYNCAWSCPSLQCFVSLRNSVAQVEGLTWYTGAISNAEWEGVALKDVLDYAPWSDLAKIVGLEWLWRRPWWKGAGISLGPILWPTSMSEVILEWPARHIQNPNEPSSDFKMEGMSLGWSPQRPGHQQRVGRWRWALGLWWMGVGFHLHILHHFTRFIHDSYIYIHQACSIWNLKPASPPTKFKKYCFGIKTLWDPACFMLRKVVPHPWCHGEVGARQIV